MLPIAGLGRLFMKKPVRLALPIAFAALLAGCTHGVEMKMAIDVLSEPEKATVSYKGKVLGETPKSLNVNTFEDVSSITVANADLEVVEKRIRIVSPDQAQVIFRMGKGGHLARREEARPDARPR